MGDRDTLTWIILGACVVLSFLFSGMEAGVMAIHRLRVRQAVKEGIGSAIALQRHLDNTEDFLWTILIGNTICNFLIFSLGTLQLSDWLRNYPVLGVMVFTLAVFVFYIVCELLPKTLFRRFPDRLTLLLARPFRFIHLGLSPIVAIVNWFSKGLLGWTGGKIFTGQLFGDREDLRVLMQDESTALSHDEKTMINRVFDLQNLRVRHIVVPLSKVATVQIDTPISDALAICRESNFNRLPVINPATGRVLGILNVAELIFLRDLDLKKTANDYLQPALFLNGGLSLEEALHRLQRGGERMAVVLGPDHRELGIISLQDILKSIFGEVNL